MKGPGGGDGSTFGLSISSPIFYLAAGANSRVGNVVEEGYSHEFEKLLRGFEGSDLIGYKLRIKE